MAWCVGGMGLSLRATQETAPVSATLPNARPRFYPLLAIVLIAFITIGFSRTFYLRFLFDLPPMRTVMLLHGIAFTAWLALFAAQTQLIATHRVDLHRKVGLAGVFLAVLVVASSVAAMLVSAATPRTTQLGFTAAQASIIPLVSTLQFALLVGAGVALRRRAGLHKRLMMLAVIGALSPATVRLIVILDLRPYALLIQMGVLAAFVTACLVYDWRKSRVVHPVFAIGGIVLVLLWPARYLVARSAFWQPIAQWIAEVGRHLL
jgi:hypothetical protein